MLDKTKPRFPAILATAVVLTGLKTCLACAAEPSPSLTRPRADGTSPGPRPAATQAGGTAFQADGVDAVREAQGSRAGNPGMVEEKGVVVSAKQKIIYYLIRRDNGSEKESTAVVIEPTKITVDGKAATFEQLQPGMQVTVAIKANAQIRFAETVEALSPKQPPPKR